MYAGRIKRTVVFIAFAVVLLAIIVWIAWSNTALELNTYTLVSDELPISFDGYRIALVSDVHNAQIGENNETLLAKLKEAKPDIIAITGDLIDSRRTDIPVALQFAEEAVKIAPCYYITGNHEARVPEYTELKNDLTQLGVTVLSDERIIVEQSTESITIIGVDDPSFQTDYLLGDSAFVMQSKLEELVCTEDAYTVLLSHRPELFEVYAENKINLVLSGHAHGGQFRLPFVGGLIAPNQGLFPKYTSGLYVQDETNMIVSRGIGNSIFPFRIYNRPEVILIELKTTT